MMNYWILFLAAFCILTALAIIFYNYRHTKRTFDTIERMLNSAIEGNFTEKEFNETRLSALETQFAHYLSASVLSARNIAIEKDKIKTLIADISHQTKTPIANLKLYSELLMEEKEQDGERLPTEIRTNIEVLHHQTEKLRFLIDSLVKLSRLENNILTLSPRQAQLQDMLENVYEQLAAKAEEKGLYFSLENTTVKACFDPKWTTEALCNIVDNAIKYTVYGGVTISTTAYELFVRIDIVDTGIGIPESEQGKIFSRFYRSETTKDSEGVGIGLYLARKIISEENGYIKVISTQGNGSKFSVFLPR